MGSDDERAPGDLGPRGSRFWQATVERWDLSGPELELLGEACRRLDRVEVLRALVESDGFMIEGSKGQLVMHPALAQERAEIGLASKLVGQLQLPDEDGSVVATPLQARARRAAQSRWLRDPYTEARRARRGSAS